MKKLINFRLILFIALCLCLGTSTAYFFLCKNWLWAVILPTLFTLSLIAYLLYSHKDKRAISIIFCLIFIAVFIIGALNFDVRVKRYIDADLNDHYYAVEGKISSIKDTEYGSYAVIKNAEVDGNIKGELKYRIALYVYGENNLQVGDRVQFYALILDKGTFYEDRFSSYDIERKIKYTASVNASDIGIRYNQKNLFEKVREGIKNTLQKGLGEEEFAIAYAMLVGEDEYIAPQTLSSFRSAGVAHIFAVSGLHIGFIAMALSLLFTKLKMNRLLKAVIITLILIFYSGVCGFSASSIRATIMSAVLLFSSVRGLKYDKFVSISLSAIIILLISPIELFCAGFQLSFTVVLGMFLLSKPIGKIFRFLPYKIASSLGAVISAQIVGFPLCLALFGEFSTIAILANLLFIPIVGVIFIALFLCTIFGWIFSISSILLFIPNYLLKGINFLVNAFDLEVFMVGGFTMGGFIVFYYLAVIVLSGFINLKSALKYVLGGVLVLTCAIGSVLTTIALNNKSRVFVCGDKTVCATLIETPTSTALIVSGAEYNFSTSRLKRLKDKVKDGRVETLILMGENKIDANRFLSVMKGVFTFDTVYYFGEQDFAMETAVIKSFMGISISSVKDSVISRDDLSFTHSLEGNLISVKVKDKVIGIFACFNDKPIDYASAVSHYDLLIADTLAESIFALYNPEEQIAYRKSAGLKDAEINGNAQFLID